MNNLNLEYVWVALRAIRSQLLRTVLTILIIGFGILSLVGMLTSIDILQQSISQNFSLLGANTFVIKNRTGGVSFGRSGARISYESISYQQASEFKYNYDFPSKVSLSAFVSSIATLSFGSQKSNPNINITGGDENYLLTAGYEISEGRNFTQQELESGVPVVIIGSEIRNLLFQTYESPLDQSIQVDGRTYRVIGVLKEAGSGFNFGRDRSAIISLQNARNTYLGQNTSYAINVWVDSPEKLNAAIGEAVGLFRILRKLSPEQAENFDVTRSDSLINTILNLSGYLRLGAVFIAIITLIGAVTGLVNIMLVAVNERTREIGLRKALGATQRSIAIQFLVEAIVICQLGGILGIVMGILTGNALIFFIGGTFIIPWKWILLSVVTCVIIGVAAGFYPAKRAANLDPIEALRYE